MALKSFSRQTLKNKSAVAAVVGSASLPVINAIVVCDSSYNELDDSALNPAGGYAKVVGNNFEAGSIVYFNGTVLTTTFISSRELRIQTPTITVGSYNLMLFNLSNGQGAIYLNLSVSNFPTITTSANTVLATGYETTAISASVAATGDAPITFSIVPGQGNLPSGVTLSSDGTLSGIAPAVGSTTTYTFVVQAKDAQLQDSTRQFSLTINTDVVDWVSPAAGTTISAYEYKPFVNTALSATSRAGYSVTYSSNTLPSGVSISGNTVVGQSNTVGTSNVTITATSNTTNKTATRNVSIVVSPDVVSWSNPTPGQIFTTYEYVPFANVNLSATSAAGFGIAYAANGLPSGLTLTDSTISGTINGVGTSNVVLIATANTTNRTANAAVQFTVNQDVVTWGTPASNTTLAVSVGEPISNITLAATSAAGFAVGYAANGLPTGLTYANGVIYGTPTVAGETSNTTLTATAATTGRTATRSIAWSVNITGDSFWNNVTLLLGADANTAPLSFAVDASASNLDVTPSTTSKASNINPYEQGYYSILCNGTANGYVSIPHNSALSIMSGSSNTFVAECYIYWNVVNANMSIMDKSGRNTISFQNWAVELNASKQIRLVWGASGTPGSSGIGILQTTIVPTTNKWYHLAFVKSNADWALFLNGTRITNYSGLNTANDANPSALRIGYGIQGEANAGFMNGYISNVRVYNGPSGTAPYLATSTSITPPTSPAMPGDNVYAVVCNSNRLKDNSSLNAAVAAGSGSKVSSLSPYTAPVTTYGSGYFDGTSYLTVPNSSQTALGSGNFTIEFWVYPLVLSGNKGLVSKRDSGYSPLLVQLESTVLKVFASTTGAGWEFAISSPSASPVANRWNHVAIVRAGSTITLYVDGVPVGTATGNANALMTTTAAMSIGATTAAGSEPFNGYISDFRIVKGTALYSANFSTSLPTAPLTAVSNTALLTLQNNAPHNSITFNDSSRFDNAITRYGNVSAGTVSPYTTANTYIPSVHGGSIFFDGTSDYLQTANNLSHTDITQTDYTIEAWVYNMGAGAERYIFSQRGASSGWEMRVNATSNVQVFFTGGTTFSSNTVVKTNGWSHVAASRAGTTFNMFIDGKLVSTGTQTNGTSAHAAYGLMLGWSTSGGGLMMGNITDARVIKGRAIYTAEFTPPTAPLAPTPDTAVLLTGRNGVADMAKKVAVETVGNVRVTKSIAPYSTGRSYYLDGNGDYINVTAGTGSINFGTGDFTIETWVRFATSNGQYNPFIRVNGGGNLDFGFDDGAKQIKYSTNVAVLSHSWTPTVGVWYRVALVRSAGKANIYIGGVNQSGAGVTDTFNHSVNAIGAVYRIGGSDYSAAHVLSGHLSDFRITKGTARTITVPTEPLPTR